MQACAVITCGRRSARKMSSAGNTKAMSAPAVAPISCSGPHTERASSAAAYTAASTPYVTA